MGRDSRKGFTELVKDRPPSTYPGKTGSIGEDAPAVDMSVIKDDIEVVKNDEQLKRTLALSVERMDAKSLAMVEELFDVITTSVSAVPPPDTPASQRVQAAAMFTKIRADTAIKMLQIITKRLPAGLYHPTVVLEGQRFEIPLDPKEWGLYQGRPHLKYSLQYVLESQNNSGYCAGTQDGECYIMSKSRENDAKVISVFQKKPDYVAPKAD